MRSNSFLTVLACLTLAACSRSTDTTGSATTNNQAPATNALNNNPSGATPMTADPSGVAPQQPASADGVQFAGGTREGGVAVGGGPAGAANANPGVGSNAAPSAGSDKAKAGGTDTKAGAAMAGDKDEACPGATDVRVSGSPSFCAKACRSDIDCAPAGKCSGTGRTSSKGYAQDNGKYCVDGSK